MSSRGVIGLVIRRNAIICFVILCGASYSFAQTAGYDPFAPRKGAARKSSGNVMSNIECVNTPITTIFKMISDATDRSIIASSGVSAKPPKVSIWIKNLTPEEVLEQVTQLAGLVVVPEGRTIKVMTPDEYGPICGVEKQVLSLKHAEAKDVVAILKSFVDKQARARIVPDPKANKIILFIKEPLLGSLKKIITAVDVPPENEKDKLSIIKLKHLDASTIAPILEEFLAKGQSSRKGPMRPTPRTFIRKGDAPRAAGEVSNVEAGQSYVVRFMVEAKLNVIVLRGSSAGVARAAALIAKLDVPREMETKSYPLQYTNCKEVFATLSEILEVGDGGKRFSIAISEQNSRIIVEGTARDHERVMTIIKAIDQPILAGAGGIRVYRLENATAKDVEQVLNKLIEETGQQASRAKSASDSPLNPPRDGIRRVKTPGKTAPGRPGSPAVQGQPSLAIEDVLPPRVIAASEINAVVIKASALEHEELSAVIREMDRPRDQVLLEVTMVTVRSDDTFDLGVELNASGLSTAGVNNIGFTHFGIGRVDTSTGQIRLPVVPDFGLSYNMFKSDDFSLVINALKTMGDVRITSSPRILVEDNSTATISQVDQQPFKVVSQGTSTTTTSFGGFVDAGTMLEVVPHIAKDEWLRLSYNISFSSFGTRVDESLPPPRLTNDTKGVARIPAEYTIMLGGLVSTRDDENEAAVPFISDIPIVGELFKSRSNSNSKVTTFIFVRPILLRDPAFEHLKFLSRADMKQARMKDTGPRNELKSFHDGLKVQRSSGVVR